MATDKNFVDFVLDQIENAGMIKARSMFGEYALFSDGKIFALNLPPKIIKIIKKVLQTCFFTIFI